jgi:hypothetical protein
MSAEPAILVVTIFGTKFREMCIDQPADFLGHCNIAFANTGFHSVDLKMSVHRLNPRFRVEL